MRLQKKNKNSWMNGLQKRGIDVAARAAVGKEKQEETFLTSGSCRSSQEE
mgnify:CR=1 FL=1